jgi:branched-chain amino acid transport system permease protein
MVESLSMNGQLVFAGLAIGGVYALVALGFVMIFRATNVVNFSQGEFSMLGAYFLFTLWHGLKLDYFVAIVLALVMMAAFGILFELTIYYPLRNRTFLPVIIATIGASIMMQNGALAVFGPSPEKVRPVIDTVGGTGGVSLAGVFFDYQYMITMLVTVLLVGLQYLFFEYTILGKKMQATSQDKDMARLLGIPVAYMIALTFIYSSLLGGLSGMLVAPIFFVTHKMGATLGYKDGFSFLLLFLFLLLRPQGIFGEKVAEKA